MTDNQRSEAEWFEIAKNSPDRRIDALGHLAKTTNPEIKHWMVRRGWIDSARIEDAMVICATAGNLLAELKAPHPDKELLESAGMILGSLAWGLGHSNLEDYADAAETTLLYMQHLSAQPDLSIDDLHSVIDIHNPVSGRWDPLNWDRMRTTGWTDERCLEIVNLAQAIKDRPEWRDKIASAMDEAAEKREFDALTYTAKSIGMDVWSKVLQRHISHQENYWHHLINTSDHARIDQLIALAAEEAGLSSESLDVQISCLERKFVKRSGHLIPIIGSDLIFVTLKSQESHKRGFALKVLESHESFDWPEGAEQHLREALTTETDAYFKARIAKLLYRFSEDRERTKTEI